MKLSDIAPAREPLSLDDRLRRLVKQELDRAETIWGEVKDDILAKADSVSLMERLHTDIPGHPNIDPKKPAVDDFIAFVADMRDSSKHLIQAISARTAKVSGFQRVFYETSALLPAIAEVVRHESGSVTEYLGDGVLALFRASDDQDEACYAALRAARKVIGDMRAIINEALDKRYDLPALNLGVGMAISKAVVTVVGHPEQRAAKAIGTCVYRASKLAKLENEIVMDENLDAVWPISKTGRGITFSRRKMGDLNGFVVPPKAT